MKFKHYKKMIKFVLRAPVFLSKQNASGAGWSVSHRIAETG